MEFRAFWHKGINMVKVGIIGLGLIGGSLGLALQDLKLVKKVLGYDLSSQNAKDALKLGLVDEIAEFETIKKTCDIIFIAIPVEAIISVLSKLSDIPKSTTIIDFGSAKEKILNSCPKMILDNFIPAHPMAGTENSGPKAAFKTLLNGAIVVICDDKKADETHVKRAAELLSHLGMKIIFMSAKDHDHHVGFISHLPHAISFSLVNATLKEEDRRNILLLSGGSFTGMARISKSNEDMWCDIFRQNKNNLLSAMQAFKREFSHCEELVKNEKWDELKEWIKNARQIREIL